jgi:hypothetical protein
VSVRKRWATGHASNWQRNAVWKRHPSQAAAYRWVRQIREEYQAGLWSAPCVKVWVDEGSGWQLYERFDFAQES